MSEKISLSADTTEAHKALDILEQRIRQIYNTEKNVIDTTEKSAKISFNRILSSARLVWSAVDQILQAMGINIGEQMRLLLQSALSSISLLYALFSAQASNPFTAAFGVTSLAELAFAVSAINAAQKGQEEYAMQQARTARAVYAVGSFLGSLSFLQE